MTQRKYKAVVIGASAGALDALSRILPSLPADYPLPIMIVVHLPPDKKSVMAELFQAKCKMAVREAEDKEPIEPGTVYFSPADYHLLVEMDHHLSLSHDEPVFFSRPSINVLFETAADAYRDSLIGIVLTGANNDGADGLGRISSYGGLAVVENPEKAYASAMPQSALAMCPGAKVMNLEDIAIFLREGIE